MSFPLTREQEAAVASDALALEIRAGAGTGKTTTLARRVARFGAEGAAQPRLQVITFTRDATATLARRLSILLGRDHGVRVHSFHQWAARELPRDGLRFFPEADARRAVERALAGAAAPLRRSLAAAGDEVAPRVLSLLSFVKNTERTLAQALDGPFSHLAPWHDALAAAQEAYEARKGDALDYDDLLVRMRDELRRSSAFRQEVLRRLDHLFVDEYQDVNGIQADVVRALTTGPGAARVTVVGDPRQSIYGFRGGAPRHLERFLEPYGRKGERRALTLNFRSGRRLVAAGNAALPDAHPLRPRPGAPPGEPPEAHAFASGEEEARAVADRIERWLALGEDPAEIAVLARTRFLLAPLADELSQRIGDDAWAEGARDELRAALEALRAAPARSTIEAFAQRAPGAMRRSACVLARRARAAGLTRARDVEALARAAAPEGLGRVALSTIHAAKGLEWDRVVLVGAREGGLPSEQALAAPAFARDEMVAEERRLFYVALTRARRSFVASWSPGGRRQGEASRFLAALAPVPRAAPRRAKA